MQLQTTLPLSPATRPIDYKSRTVLLGSCFTEHIGDKLAYYQFRNYSNPLGIYYHPKAIETLLDRIIEDRPFGAADVFEYEEQWHSYEAHSRLSQLSEKALLRTLNERLSETRDYLISASHIFLTLGTAWGYRLKDTGKWVANCHKVPQKEFSKELLGVDEIETCLQHILGMIRELNPEAQVVFSISPVRHLKDGFVENQRSKAHLIAAVHGAIQEGKAAYFPAYELFMDELRDYRFYGEDLVHPNALAVGYIWEKFRQVWISEGISGIMQKVSDIRRGLAHRPFNPESTAHKKFQTTLNDQIEQLKQEYPFMEF
ncbi:MAG: GSCFA domain-containing protein [Eudoraea sp.]|nr:GSCFA domain-containing protein [Eudoraea sp.]NNK30995.1 GSCFA domain-containing protein [Flavobacteriaceae bacterium]